MPTLKPNVSLAHTNPIDIVDVHVFVCHRIWMCNRMARVKWPLCSHQSQKNFNGIRISESKGLTGCIHLTYTIDVCMCVCFCHCEPWIVPIACVCLYRCIVCVVCIATKIRSSCISNLSCAWAIRKKCCLKNSPPYLLKFNST